MHVWNLDDPGQSDVLRTKVGVSRQLKDGIFSPHVDYEIFYLDEISQHRFYAGGKIKLNRHNVLDVFYLYQILPLKDKGTHIAGLSWDYLF